MYPSRSKLILPQFRWASSMSASFSIWILSACGCSNSWMFMKRSMARHLFLIPPSPCRQPRVRVSPYPVTRLRLLTFLSLSGFCRYGARHCSNHHPKAISPPPNDKKRRSSSNRWSPSRETRA
eukprot:Pompholyxophrys_punicea_v1_NODE_523_length_1771_cov_1.611305.p4 type:complete len:123 gc:universal NODE_523_length_1771_cov_1.611305:1120-752(-)